MVGPDTDVTNVPYVIRPLIALLRLLGKIVYLGENK